MTDAIEASAPGEHIDEEDEFATSDYDNSSISSSSVSLTSSVYQHAYENGRRYHQYRHGTYPIPNDDAEQNRDDMKHAMMLELTDGKLFFAPVGDGPMKIIDLATGTGIWAVDVADKYPSAEVLGIDLSPIQPIWVPPNLKFVLDDIEDGWTHGDDWDFVHMRWISPWLKDELKFLRRAYQHLKPGAWIEIQELDPRANCDYGSMSSDAPLAKFFDTAETAVKQFGRKFRAGENLRQPLIDAGNAVSDMFGAMAAKPLRKIMDPVEIDVFLSSARKDLHNPGIHSYEKYYFWMGQKPPAEASNE